MYLNLHFTYLSFISYFCLFGLYLQNLCFFLQNLFEFACRLNINSQINVRLFFFGTICCQLIGSVVIGIGKCSQITNSLALTNINLIFTSSNLQVNVLYFFIFILWCHNKLYSVYPIDWFISFKSIIWWN